MTFSYRSCPHKKAIFIVCENKGGWSMMCASESMSMTAPPPGTIRSLPLPSKVKSRATKQLHTTIKNNSQVGGTDTRRASRQEPSDSRRTHTKRRTGSWRTSSNSFTASQYKTHITMPCMADACTASLTLPETFANRSTIPAPTWPATCTKLPLQCLQHLCYGTHTFQHPP